jgi:hypothetical protein
LGGALVNGALLSVLAVAAGGAALGCAAAPNASDGFARALHADAPLSALREPLMTFGQFVGDWDMDIIFYDEAGRVAFHGPGRWCFGWILDGRAIQDVITYADLNDPIKAGPGERRIGTTLRQLDPSTSTWRVVWLGASSGAFVVLTGQRSGDRIVLEGSEGLGIRNRWSFSEVEPDRFHWRGEISHDGGATWRLEQEMFGRRSRSGA